METLFKISINAGQVEGGVIVFGYTVTLRLENALPRIQSEPSLNNWCVLTK